MSENRERIIDEILDDTLREIAAVDPPRGLEHRVMARVRQQAAAETGLHGKRAGARAHPYAWMAAAAVLAVAISGWLLWRGAQDPSRNVPRQADVHLAPEPRATTASPETGRRLAAEEPSKLTTRRRAERHVDEWAPASAVPPLPRPQPLAIAALQPPPITLETVDLQPLAAETPLEITPLNPSAGEPAGPESKERR
jgi:hypothetical protein